MFILTNYLNDKITELTIDFRDEGVDLIGVTEVVGDEGKALAYAPFFEADLRRNNAELFPVPEMPEAPEEMPGGDE